MIAPEWFSTNLVAFLAAVVLISASPGPAVALLVRRSARDGRRAGVVTVMGLETGLYLWILAAGAGLTALIAASETAYTVLRIAGAVVLLWLGIGALRSAWRGHGGHAPDNERPDGPPARSVSLRRCYVEGLLTNLLNPKAAVFVFAFYPQFIPAGADPVRTAAALGLLQVAIELVLYIALVAGVVRARSVLTRPRVARGLDAAAGTVMVGLGLRLAFDRP